MSADDTPDYFVDLEEAKLRARYVKVTLTSNAQVQKLLSSKPTVYTVYDATEVRTRQLVAGQRLYTLNIFLGPNGFQTELFSHW